ncbi:MAG: DUF1343 domain-containing protein [Archangiaceae bacterium]|nr:DUF1343 domain-containing protein [Archangiaceae bacterium]
MVRSGLDVWASQGFAALKGLKVGAIVNPTSVDQRFTHLADLLAATPGVTLAALFGPEHGIRGEAQYMVAVDDVARDKKTQVPTYSLYGHSFESLSPQPEWLNGLDALVFDIQDVGSRYYTYVYTMALAMKAAARAKITFYVLDRPNPIGLSHVEGNAIGEKYKSFVGLYSMPNRHGMTAGELARYFNHEEAIGCELHVASCEGLTRAMGWADTGRLFVPPSPNMPTVDTALVYPGMCFAEGTNISEGRGTCRPFEQFGAPWLDGGEVAVRLNALKLPGVIFRPVAFTPTFDKHRGVSCEGAFIHVTDRDAFRPWRTGIAIFRTLKELSGDRFEWRRDAYEFVKEVPAFDLLAGTDRIRLGIDALLPLDQLADESGQSGFLEKRSRYLLYS